VAEQIVVYVNDDPVKIFLGMEVRHALISYDYAVYRKAKEGEILIEDERGFPVGLEGGLQRGSRVYTKERKVFRHGTP
jgi:hypothetical protein